MKKSDLKTGMLVINRKGARALVFKGTQNGDVFSGGGGENQGYEITWMGMDIITEDLRYAGSPEFDIIKVYSNISGNNQLLCLNTAERSLIWERKDDIKIGKDVVIFNDNNIKVGCTTVDKETVKKIYNKLYNIE